jgi:hypothetical protein
MKDWNVKHVLLRVLKGRVGMERVKEGEYCQRIIFYENTTIKPTEIILSVEGDEKE